MTKDAPTRLRLFVPCREASRVAIEHEWIENPRDGSFARAFGFGTVDDAGQRGIEAATGALVLYCPFDLGADRAEAIELVTGISSAIAVRVEQSKLGWLRDAWLEMIAGDNSTARHRAVVTLLGNDEYIQSCGMHAFSLPDARIANDADANELNWFLSLFNIYRIEENPLMLSGQTFTPDEATSRRVLQRWPDDGYPQSSPCHNPYGVWRFGPGGGTGTPQSKTAPVFVPPLVTLLQALESKNGAPLTRAQVEETRDNGPCIEMKREHARAMERSRGYADIDPELAWGQWQIVRATAEDD
jgi:hypothetical protein